MFQQMTIVGNVGADAEMRYAPDGVPVSTFRVATSRKFGQGEEKTIWFRVTVWRKTAETVAQYVKKGMKVLVVGELEEPRIYNDKNSGEARVSLEITGQTIKFLSSRQDDAGSGSQQRAPAQRTQQVQPDIDDEDIPF